MENPFSRFDERRRQREAKRLELNKQLAELNAEGEKDAIAVAQLRAVYPNGFPNDDGPPRSIDRRPADAIESPPAPPATAAQAQNVAGGNLTVKEMALMVLRDAMPNGLTAAQIKGKAFLRFKKHINPNTLTVSLVRLKPKVKCEGRIWFYERPSIDGDKVHDQLPLAHDKAAE